MRSNRENFKKGRELRDETKRESRYRGNWGWIQEYFCQKNV